MTTVLGAVPARWAMFYPALALALGYLLAKLLAAFRTFTATGVAEALLVLTWLVWTWTRPGAWAAARWLALLGIQSAEPAALAIPAMQGQMAAVALAWTSRALAPHRLDQIRSAQALGAMVFAVVVTLAALNTWGALPLGLTATACLAFHWHWHQRTGGATADSLSHAADVTECLSLAFSAWLF